MENNKRNDELKEVIQTIKDMIVALLRNQRLEETTESQGLVKFSRNKALQFSRG